MSSTYPTTGWEEVEDDTVTLSNAATGTYYLHLKATDYAGNVTQVTHATPFVVPEKTPPTITLTLNELEAGVNNYGTLESAFTVADLTDTTPDKFTARATTITVVAEKSEKGSDLSALILPSGEAIYDNDDATTSEVYVNGIQVIDLDETEGVIKISYTVSSNGYYAFYVMDVNGNMDSASTNVTAMDADDPVITYTLRNSESGSIVMSTTWVSEEDGLDLTLFFDDIKTSIYNEYGSITGYVGTETVSYLILEGGESQYEEDGTEKDYTKIEGNTVTISDITVNGTYTILAKDEIGNTATKTISITNIDTTRPFVDTTNTTFGVGASPIELQLKFYDTEMGLVDVAQYQITNSEETPDSWLDYDGTTISITEVGTWYVHYRAEDGVGHVTTGCFGPYIIDSGQPAITITSSTADNWVENDGVITYYKDDNYASTHDATVTIDFPSTFEDIEDETIQYQWSSTIIANPFGWTTVDSDDIIVSGDIATFDVSKTADSNTQGRRYLYVKVSGTSVYRGFLFDSEMPTITVIGDIPAYQIRGISYTDRGATAYDEQQGSVTVSTKITEEDGSTTDTKYITTDTIGEQLVQYSASDDAGNTATNSRIVYVYDSLAPYVFDFSGETKEDTAYTFTKEMFLANYDDDTADSMASVTIAELPAHGVLRYQGAIVAEGAVFTVEQLDGLEYHPNENWFGTDTFAYKGSDTGIGDRAGNLSVDSAEITIEVESVNDIPVADKVVSETEEDEEVVIDMSGSIYDVEDDATLTITLGTITVVNASTSNVTAVGSASVDQTNQKVTYTPAADFNGTVTIPYTITDGDEVTVGNTIIIAVHNVNDNPVVSDVKVTEAYDNNGVTEDGLYRGGTEAQAVEITWNCLDVDNDVPTYTLYYVADEAEPVQIVSNLASTSYEWQIPAIDGEYEIRVVANDKQSENNLSDAVDSDAFVVDSTKPESIVFYANEWPYTNDNTKTITISATDDRAEQSTNNLSVYYAVDTSTDGRTYVEGEYASIAGNMNNTASDPWAILTNAITINAEGENQVRAYVVDQAGNTSAVATSGSYEQDYTAPTKIEISSVLHEVATTNDSDAKASVTITGVTTDTNTGKAVSELADSPYRYAVTLADSTEELTYSDWQASKSYTYEGLTPNTEYTYTMQAIDKAGNIRTDSITEYTLAQDAQSVTLTEWDADSLTITFTAPENPEDTEYQAWVVPKFSSTKTAETEWTSFEVSDVKNTFTFDGLEEDTQYTVYIQAKNEDGVENTAVAFSTDTTDENFKTNDTATVTLDDQDVTAYYKKDGTIKFTGTVKDTDVDYHEESEKPTVVVEVGGVTKTATLTPVTQNAIVALFTSGSATTEWTWEVTYDVSDELKSTTDDDYFIEDGLYQPTVTVTDNKGDVTEDKYQAIYIDTLLFTADLDTPHD